MFAILNKVERQKLQISEVKKNYWIDERALFAMVCVIRLPYCAVFVYVRECVDQSSKPQPCCASVC